MLAARLPAPVRDDGLPFPQMKKPPVGGFFICSGNQDGRRKLWYRLAARPGSELAHHQ